MNIIIDKHGTFIGKKQGRLVLYTDEKSEEYSITNIERIILYKSCGISSSAIALIVNSKKDLTFMDRFGMPVAKLYYITNENFPILRKMQYKKSIEKNIDIIQGIVHACIKNKIGIIKSLAYSRKRTSKEKCNLLMKYAGQLETWLSKIYQKQSIEELRGIEGISAKLYFESLRKIIPKFFRFNGRTRPPQDIVNASLSYGYGILFSELWKYLVMKGFDPYIGFYHEEKGRKPCLVLDFMEEFRQPIVDSTILRLVFKKILNPKKHGGMYLNEKGRKIVIENVLNKLDKTKSLIKKRINHWVDYILDRSEFVPFGESNACNNKL